MARSETERARARLRRWLALFFLALAVPGGVLVYWAYDQLKWESFRRQQVLAQDLADGVDRRLADLVRTEEARPPEDYGFLLASGDADRPEGRRSPLAAFPPGNPIPGLLGWFEVGEDGRFGTPWVPGPGVSPARLGIDPAELAQRQAAAHRIEAVLIGNRLADAGATGGEAVPPEPEQPDAAPSPAPAARAEYPSSRDERAKGEAKQASETRLSQAAFERLAAQAPARGADAGRSPSLGHVEDPVLDSGLARRRQVPAPLPAGPETESDQVVAQQARPGLTDAAPVSDPVLLFHVAQEPFRLARLDSGHLVLFRRALKGGEQVIQGLLLELAPFLAGLVGEPFAASPLAGTAVLTLAHRGELLTTLGAQGASSVGSAREDYAVRAQGLSGELLLRARPQEPFGALELIFSSRRLPVPPGPRPSGPSRPPWPWCCSAAPGSCGALGRGRSPWRASNRPSSRR